MSTLRSFAPWIAYVAASAAADWRLGALAGLAVAVGLWWHGRHTGTDLLTVVTVGFFAVLAPVAIAAPDAAIRPFTPALSLATLGAAAGASLVLGQPFTMAIARRETPAELWDTELFRRANVVITSAWTASFWVTAAACAALIEADPSNVVAWVGVQVVGFGVPVAFTRWYRARLAARLLSGLAA